MKRKPEALPQEVVELLAPFFPGFDLSLIRVYEGIPRYVIGNPAGYTNRHKIFFAPGAYRVDRIEGLVLIAHEIAHCLQYRQHGAWRFRALYLAAYFKSRRRGMTHDEAYRNIPFEIEAREAEAMVYSALQRLHSNLTARKVPPAVAGG